MKSLITAPLQTTEQNGRVLKQQVIDIGVWDMDTDGSKNVNHSIDVSKIVCVESVIIRDDQLHADSLDIPHDWNVIAGYWSVWDTHIYLARNPAGFFNDPTYNSVLVNRGYVTITYFE